MGVLDRKDERRRSRDENAFNDKCATTKYQFDVVGWSLMRMADTHHGEAMGEMESTMVSSLSRIVPFLKNMIVMERCWARLRERSVNGVEPGDGDADVERATNCRSGGSGDATVHNGDGNTTELRGNSRSDGEEIYSEGIQEAET